MSAEFARVLILNINRRIRFAKSVDVKIALEQYRDAIKETMIELGHKL